MDEEKFDAIVVGGGLAGIACAYTLAKKGGNVIVFERGDYCGAKNVTGGRIYLAPVREMFPELWAKAPFERPIVREEVVVMGEEDSLTLSYSNQEFADEPSSYSINRAKFDKWFAKQAVRAGATIVPKAKVESLVKGDGGEVKGVVVGGEEMLADVVVLCEGALGLLAREAGLAKPLAPAHFAVGVKEVIELPEKTIEDRFALNPGEGAARLFMGDATGGKFGGGIIYTNKTSLSIGLLFGVHDACTLGEGEAVPEMLERFKSRSDVAPLIEGGSLAEYSAHVVPESGKGGMSQLYADGVLVAGEAAGFSLNDGLIVRGMDYAMASGYYAAIAVCEAEEKQDFTAQTLSCYVDKMQDGFCLQDMDNYERVPESLNHPRLFNYYPKLIGGIMKDLFTVPSGPKPRIFQTLKKHVTGKVVRDIAFKDFKKVKNL